MRLQIVAALALLILTGCGKKADVVGKWDFPVPGMPMQLEFKNDGTYGGTAMGGAAKVTGTYKVEGKVLALDPPQITGPAGNATPPGGQMRLEMKAVGPNAYALSAPGIGFTMTKMGG